jgi:hypothetical protein
MKMKTNLDQNSSVDQILFFLKENFGSVRRFNLLAGRPEFDLYYLKKGPFKRQGKLKQIRERVYSDIERLKDTKSFISASDRDLVQSIIWAKYRTASAFCERFPEFTSPWLSRFLNGQFKRFTKKIARLFAVLEIDY